MQNKDAFLALVRSGLWEQEARLLPYGKVDLNEVFHLAQEQSVLGLVTAGLDHVVDVKTPYETRLMFVGSVSEIEQRNKAMNRFITELFAQLNKNGIYALLVKGQGIAQCYDKPLCRNAGDVDLLLDENNYNKAKAFLSPLSEKTVVEDFVKKHLSVQISGFTIELHGRMPFVLSRRVDRVIDDVITDSMLRVKGGSSSVRVWKNGNTDICLPNADNDVILVFTHFLHHFFIEGVGLKQICDWCRLLWTFKDELDKELLGKRLREMGLMSEWKVFASFAVNRLGMPQEAMPFYDDNSFCKRKANRVLSHIMKSGNLGHNNDVSYRAKYSTLVSNTTTFFRRLSDHAKFTLMFPLDAPAFFGRYVFQRTNER